MNLTAPAVPRDLVARERLIDQLRRGTEGPLTLVSAPAGSGKSVLVASWVAAGEAPGPVVWVTLEDCEGHPGMFWSYVIDGLRRAGVVVDDVAVPVWAESISRADLMSLAELLAQRTEPVVLVLDDAYCLVDRALASDLGFLIGHCGPSLRVVLLTRADPALPLYRYRLEGVLREIRAADLAFTEPETTVLLAQAGVDVATAEARTLVARTAGWAAGLKFAAMTLAGRPDPGAAIRDFSGDEGNVAAYLVTEVLDAQTPEMRDILLRTSIVNRLHPGLMEVLTGVPQGSRTLEELEHANGFIQPVPGIHGCYRYQALFREFLRAQLVYERPDLVPELHLLAAQWFAEQGLVEAAALHAARAGDWSCAADYVIDHHRVSLLATGRATERLRSLFAELPAADPSASAAIVRAALALGRGANDYAVHELSKARQLLGASGSQALAVDVLTALACSRTGDVQDGLGAVARARVEAGLLGDVPADVLALVALCEGELRFWQGEFTASCAALAEAAGLAEGCGSEAIVVRSLAAQSLVEAASGHLRRAAELTARVDEIAGAGDALSVHSSDGALAQAWVRLEQDERESAQRIADSIEPRGLLSAEILALVRARLLRASDEAEAAQLEIKTARANKALPGWLDGRLAVLEAAPTLADDELVTVASTTDVDESCAPSAPLVTQVEGWLARAVAASLSRDPVAAGTAVDQALRLAAPELLRRPFGETPTAVRRMLRGGAELSVRHAWLEKAPRGRSTTANPRPQRLGSGVIVEPLTAKEQEVLGHLANLLTTEEIAATMFVSVNTVRTHVRSILRKLGVSRRNEAIRRAWELRLLPELAGAGVPAPRAEGRARVS